MQGQWGLALQALHFLEGAAFPLQGLPGYAELLCIVAPGVGAWNPLTKEPLHVRLVWGLLFLVHLLKLKLHFGGNCRFTWGCKKSHQEMLCTLYLISPMATSCRKLIGSTTGTSVKEREELETAPSPEEAPGGWGAASPGEGVRG